MDEYISFWDEDPEEAMTSNGCETATRTGVGYDSDEDHITTGSTAEYGRHFPLGWISQVKL